MTDLSGKKNKHMSLDDGLKFKIEDAHPSVEATF
jgi:hypothetical protein